MEKAMTEHEIEAVVREVTDEEVAFYWEYGWVMMKQLVAPKFATELLRVGKEWRQRREKEAGPGKPSVGLALDETAEPFRSFMFSQRMAKNATRLVNRKRLKGVDIPLRYRIDMLLLKPPGAAGATYHQDASEHGSDRVGELQFWLALAEVTAEMSAMRFVNRSHREGPLGSVFNDDKGDLLEQYPMLTSELGLSAPFHYQPVKKEGFPLALISPSNNKMISSSLGEFNYPELRLTIHPTDAVVRQITNGDTVRVFNELGEVICRAQVSTRVREGVVSLPKGAWRKSSLNGFTSTALCPADINVVGGGACFNDARVEVEKKD